jgi:hypothetical protein
MVGRLYDLKTLRREFLRHRKHPGGRKDQRFWERSLNDNLQGRLIILSVNEKHSAFLGPRRWSPDRTLALILGYFVSGVGSLSSFIFYQTTLRSNVASL